MPLVPRTIVRRKRQSRRGRPRESRRRPPLTIRQILIWADAWYARFGRWPMAGSGAIPNSSNETWYRIHAALRFGWRGLPGGSTLARLLLEMRGVRYSRAAPKLSEAQILSWADRHFERTGRWPTAGSGQVSGSFGETWRRIDSSLRLGLRGLKGGASLSRLLREKRGVRYTGLQLSEQQLLAWADAFRKRHGRWPTARAVKIAGSYGDTWRAVDSALRLGLRGLKGGSSLARFLREKRGVRFRGGAPNLTERQIVAWADAHRARTGRWPVQTSGLSPGSYGETWVGVNAALRMGRRGLREEIVCAGCSGGIEG